MIDIFGLKNTNETIIEDLKRDIEDLGNKRKEKEAKPILHEIKESFQMIDEASQKLTLAL